MFRAEHEAALRQQIRSLVALKMPEDHPLAKEMNETLAEQAVLLEEIRIGIHNWLLGYHPPPIELTPEQIRKFQLQDRRSDGILT